MQFGRDAERLHAWLVNDMGCHAPSMTRCQTAQQIARRVLIKGFKCEIKLSEDVIKSSHSHFGDDKKRAFMNQKLTGNLTNDFTGIEPASLANLAEVGITNSDGLFAAFLSIIDNPNPMANTEKCNQFYEQLGRWNVASRDKATIIYQLKLKLAVGIDSSNVGIEYCQQLDAIPEHSSPRTAEQSRALPQHQDQATSTSGGVPHEREEVEEVESSSSTPAPAPASDEEAPVPSKSSAKRKVLVQVEGDADMVMEKVQSRLKDLVRDHNISVRKDDVIKAHSEKGAYYLSPRRPAVANAKGHVHTDEVDHTVECQLVGHAILQTREFHEVLTDLDMDGSCTRINKQPHVVRNALGPIFVIQNCIGDETCFNLRLISQSLNKTKGHVITEWIKSRNKSQDYLTLNHLPLQDAFRKCQALKDGEIDQADADELAAALQESLVKAEDEYQKQLGARAEKLDKSKEDYRNLAKRLEALQETMASLRDEHENE